ncbi:peptidase, m16 family [Heliomicrobium modesticaldum Ice1]|uniref:Peptidase, m16 family n=1 Tax=Heliobacterium modesticaldum (strain ATCC 51547 / Ice1) TaxID=498761 RepID=B0THS5_HELMI|nr:pitrilysin family protein [Heliomicrobium modesticaldum]ABZ84858.1 peptidase, m16 family [Heliomicrobium modesticaldum Ice1]
MVHKTVLPNGVRVVMEPISHVRSVALGIWVATGSRDEEPALTGVSHFIEHMLFKGTDKRTAKDLAEVLEAVGGQLNAFTSKEYTCYHAKVLDDHFDLALDVLADMFFHSRFEWEDIERERRVILEEIKMYEDSPDELVHDLLADAMWPFSPLGRSILGTVESIQAMQREGLLSHFQSEYSADRTVIAIAGSIDPDKALEKVKAYFSVMDASKQTYRRSRPDLLHKSVFLHKDVEQVQICLGTQGLPQEHRDIYAMHVLNNVIGGGTSSRLFQEIRENRGLAYSVYSFHSAFSDSGMFGLYAGTSPDFAEEVLEISLREMARIREEGICPEELRRTQEQIKGSLYLGLESVNSRMTRLGKSEICYNRFVSPEEVIDRVYAVTLDDVTKVARDLWTPEQCALAVVGAKPLAVELSEMLRKSGW